MNTLAKAGAGGGEPLIANPDAAQLNRNLAIANLVLAGVDVLAVGVDGVKVANKLLSKGGSDVISKLTPKQISKFNTIVTSPDDVQSQKLYQSLQQELGTDFDEAHSVFARANQQVGGKTAEFDLYNWSQEIENPDFPEFEKIRETMRNNPSGGDELLKVELEKLRLDLLRNTQDLGNIYDVMRKSGIRVSREDIAAVKQYNFNSPGINFNPDNYKSWVKLAKGKGSIRDAHYLMHEIEEIKQFKKIQQETGFDFMGKDYFKMNDAEKKAWDAKFYDKNKKSGYYIQAHSKAVEHEYKFIASQITRFTDGAVKLNGKEDYLKLIFQEPKIGVKDDHIKNMQINGITLKDHLAAETSYYRKIQNDANKSVQLPAHLERKIRARFRIEDNQSVKLSHLIQWVRVQKLKQP